MTSFLAQIRRNADAPWFTVNQNQHSEAGRAAVALNDDMQQAGFRFSELHDHRADLVAGHVLTADNGTQFRVVDATELPVVTKTNVNAERLADEMHEELRHGLLAQLINERLSTLPEAAQEEIGHAYAVFGDALLGAKYRARANTYRES